MKLIAVVGSRQLAASSAERVGAIVTCLVQRGCRIGSGGALGTDLFALQAVVRLGQEACTGSRIFLPGSIEQAPLDSRDYLVRFRALGGEVITGPVAGRTVNRHAYIEALRQRTVALVQASSGVVAFVSGVSRGTWFTCEQAVRLSKPVVVVPAQGPGSLRALGCGRWQPLGIWHGAWQWTPSVPNGNRCRHGLPVAYCMAGIATLGAYWKEDRHESD